MSLGFQIMADKNRCIDEKIRSSLLTYILTNEELRRRFILTPNKIDGNWSHEVPSHLRWLCKSHGYLNPYWIRNASTGNWAGNIPHLKWSNYLQKCFLSLWANILFLCEYSKTRSMTRDNSGISRFMDKEASVILLKDLLLIRPLVCSMASFLGLNEGRVYNNYLFVINGTTLKASDICNHFCRLFDRLTGGCTISFRDYRQVAKYFANTMLVQSQIYTIMTVVAWWGLKKCS